jgi:hypothetical protein
LAQAQSIRRRLHPDRAEFSCIVADHFQHRGQGGILLALALLARAEGIREWTAEVLPRIAPCWRCCAAGLAAHPGDGTGTGVRATRSRACSTPIGHKTKGE